MVGPLEEMLSRAGPLDSYSAQLVMREAYEQAYEIFDHEKLGEANPLAIVSMHPKEDVWSYSPLYRMITKYMQYNVGKYLNIPFDRFIELPRDITEQMFKACNRQAELEAPVIQNAVNEMARDKREAAARNRYEASRSRRPKG